MRHSFLIIFLFFYGLIFAAPSEKLKDEDRIKGSLFHRELFRQGQSRDKELPSFDNQTEALGYTPYVTFSIPPDLQNRVNFWKKIYSEYSSHQAVLHDSDYPEVVYGIVDLSEYREPLFSSYAAMQSALKKRLKREKEKIAYQLQLLHRLNENSSTIPAVLYPLYKKFEGVKERNRFLEAAERIRAQVGQRDKIIQGFLFGGRYFSRMMEIFAERKIPQELTRLTLVESAFNLNARSKVGASGIWQFMRTTGKQFLRIDRYIDERNDPIAATYAAADLLSQNFEALGSWPLAITAWNHGREGVARASRTLTSTSLPYIIKNYRRKTFGFASSNFYSEFLAVLEVEREYRKQFGSLLVDGSVASYEMLAELKLADDMRFSRLVSECQMNKNEFHSYNLGLTEFAMDDRGPLPRGLHFRVPNEKQGACLRSSAIVKNSSRWNLARLGKGSLKTGSRSGRLLQLARIR